MRDRSGGEWLGRRLGREVLVCDGGITTVLTAAGVSEDDCLPQLSRSRPDLVRAVHGAYASAGVDLLQTNTYMANALWLARFGLDAATAEINEAGVGLAQAAAEEAERSVLVAGTIGPAVPPRDASTVSRRAVVRALVEQASVLEACGVDLLLFETFGDLGELIHVLEAVKGATRLPVLAQLAFVEEACAVSGESPEWVATALERFDLAAIGVNCTPGPRAAYGVVARLARTTDRPLSVQPNAGPATYFHGHFRYPKNEDYFARAAREFVEIGASIVGGCCGTTPTHMRAVAGLVRGLQPAPRRTLPSARPHEGSRLAGRAEGTGVPCLREQLEHGHFVLGCQLRFPGVVPPEHMTDEALAAQKAGARFVVLDTAEQRRARMDAVTCGLLLHEHGIDVALTATTNGKSAVALQAELLGAHTFGLRTVICRTSATPEPGDVPRIDGLFAVGSADLIRLLGALNERREVGAPPDTTSFYVGARTNPSAPSLEEELGRVRDKIVAGAAFLVTDPVFDVAVIKRFREELGLDDTPILLGVQALTGSDDVEYLRNEVAGVKVPAEVGEQLRRADDPVALGISLAADLVRGARPFVQGVVVTPSSGSGTEASRLLERLSGL